MGSDKQHQAVEKYLAGYSEPEVTQLSNIHAKYDHTLVIPLYDESFDDVLRLLNTEFSSTHSSHHLSVLFVLVVNCPEGGDGKAETRTTSLLQALKERVQTVSIGKNLHYGELVPGRGAIIVDRCSEGQRIPIKQGVGLARKVGADIACYLIANQTIKSRWIHSTDADVTLPDDYFDCVNVGHIGRQAMEESVALVYPFIHVAETGYETASELYDWSLRYYVESLQWAGSGYAYHTIGSLIAVDFEAYAKVRGFPKRSGGEDFYLLNKLAKVGPISNLPSPTIHIAARPSQRVPFGTGPAICKITENKHAVASHVFYHPGIFQQLKLAHQVINKSWHARKNNELESSANILESLEIEAVGTPLIEALEALGFAGAWKHAVIQSGTEQQFKQQMKVWFDAFKTLKFIHYLRDHGYASLILNEVLNESQVLSVELRDKAVKLLSMTATEITPSN